MTVENAEPPVLDGRTLRNVMSNFCTGVTVITAHDGNSPLGFTCQSLVSVSLDPPLLSFCPAKTSTSWPKLRETGTLCVEWDAAGNGAPALSGALARIEATVEQEHDAGDHTIVVARITDLNVLRHDGPLLFYRGGFGRFDA